MEMCTSNQYTIDAMFWISAYKIYSRHIIMPVEIIKWDKLSKVLIYRLLILEVYLWIRLSIDTKTPRDCTSIIITYWRSKTVERNIPFHGFGSSISACDWCAVSWSFCVYGQANPQIHFKNQQSINQYIG